MTAGSLSPAVLSSALETDDEDSLQRMARKPDDQSDVKSDVFAFVPETSGIDTLKMCWKRQSSMTGNVHQERPK